MSEQGIPSVWLQGLKTDYRAVFVEPWPAYTGAVLLVVIMAVLMGSGAFWGVFGAGLTVGLLESLVGAFAGAEWEPIVVAVLLLGVLQVRQVLAR